MPDTICVAAQQRGVYCQTFIRAHITLIPAEVKEFYVSELPAVEPSVIGEFLATSGAKVVLAEFGDTGVHMMEACHTAGVPLVVRFGGADAYSETPKWLAYRRFYLPLFKVAPSIVAVSRDMLGQLERLGCPPDKIRYCPSGADTSLFNGATPASAPPVFLAVGRFVEKKAPYLTLLAFSTIVQAFAEARLVMAGDGHLLEVCKRLANALRIEDAVVFKGACSHEEVASLMRGARCFVQHSVRAFNGDSEGTPNSVMEAGAAGLPVVATRHAGIADVVVEGETGFLVEEGDVAGMAAQMLRLAHDSDMAGRLGASARERVRRHFSMDKSIADLWAVLSHATDS
jgi:colanic acid/amylovoran biosynthesis glycosyltransferase